MSDRAKILQTDILSDNFYVLKKVKFDYQHKSGEWITQIREVYDRGNGAAVLLYNAEKKTIILTRQFRLPTLLNGNDSGMLIEVCAGELDADQPEACAIREAEEETGFRISSIKKIFELYTSPGAVTEIIHFFVAPYSDKMRVNEGGGVDKNEDIDVIELRFEDALERMERGEIKDAKTVVLLQYAKIHNLV